MFACFFEYSVPYSVYAPYNRTGQAFDSYKLDLMFHLRLPQRFTAHTSHRKFEVCTMERKQSLRSALAQKSAISGLPFLALTAHAFHGKFRVRRHFGTIYGWLCSKWLGTDWRSTTGFISEPGCATSYSVVSRRTCSAVRPRFSMFILDSSCHFRSW
ncbi:hypothetical protein CPSG_04579 [Coccidioides posadasii str. Silveira]|uniref:Uncharacterized protein n=1 Tax=Coccidioides posadasii (strain RMSCC 757 / Silveira) TaxID=443226 RepID=E9D338_COCPS|nr:hypothetical protein CPSG_04579 [Coccidioides posadasii str. Silveira]